MIVKVDKCSAFGIKKTVFKSIHFLPKLIIDNTLVSRIKIGKSFKYLGRYFDFDMTNEARKLELSIKDLMSKIDFKPLALHPKNKVLFIIDMSSLNYLGISL